LLHTFGELSIHCQGAVDITYQMLQLDQTTPWDVQLNHELIIPQWILTNNCPKHLNSSAL
jgi:hypothetical protein